MLINLWYVAEWSHAVKDKPVKVKLLGQNFVLFRDEAGTVSCLADVCLHRGGSLSGGWTKDNCVVCPYHGWEYNSRGECTRIPSEGDDYKIPKRARVDSYPTEERYGMIWVFLGDLPEDKRYPIPPFPEYDDPQWRKVTTEFTWNGETSRVVENGIDIAHTSFVHPTFGQEKSAQKNHIESVEKHEWWATSSNVMYPPQLKGSFGLRRLIRKKDAMTRVHPSWYMPGNVIRLVIEANPKWHIILFDANTPVDEHTTRSFVVQMRNFFKWPMFDKGSIKRTHKIFREDAKIVEDSQPYYLPEDLSNEISVKSDKFMSSYRFARRNLIEKNGWLIDSAAIEKHRNKTVFTISSPSRREAEAQGIEWNFAEVPLVAPKRKERFSQEEIEVATDFA